MAVKFLDFTGKRRGIVKNYTFRIFAPHPGEPIVIYPALEILLDFCVYLRPVKSIYVSVFLIVTVSKLIEMSVD